MDASTHEQSAHDPHSHSHDPGREEPPPSVGEWIAAAVGLVLLLASLAYLLHDAWTGEEGAPAPVVRLVTIQAQEGRYLVQVEVFNDSRSTAAALQVEGELRQAGEVVERSQLEFQHLPGRSARQGGLFFQQDPRALQLVLSARSYQKP